MARVRREMYLRGMPANEGGGGAVDALVVTVAPVLVGDAGVGYGAGLRADEVRP